MSVLALRDDGAPKRESSQVPTACKTLSSITSRRSRGGGRGTIRAAARSRVSLHLRFDIVYRGDDGRVGATSRTRLGYMAFVERAVAELCANVFWTPCFSSNTREYVRTTSRA